MNDKEQWPTPARLEELRSQGIICWSRNSVVAIRAAAILLTLGTLKALVKSVQEALRQGQRLDSEAFTNGIKIMAFITCSAIGVSILSSLLQTRWYFQPKLHRPSVFRKRQGIGGALLQVSSQLVFLGGMGIIAYLSVPSVLALLNVSPSLLLQKIAELSSFALMILVASAVLASALFYISHWIQFRLEHRMSRTESLRGTGE